MSGQQHALAALYPWKDAVPIVQEAGWVPGPVWTAENLAPPGFDLRTVQPVVAIPTELPRPPRLNVETHKCSALILCIFSMGTKSCVGLKFSSSFNV